MARQTGTLGGVERLHCNSYSTEWTVLSKDNFLCSHFYFCFFLCAMHCCLFLSVSHDMVCQQMTVQTVNENHGQSFAINLPHTLRCNLQFTTFVFKTLAIVTSEHPSRLHCNIDNITKKFY